MKRMIATSAVAALAAGSVAAAPPADAGGPERHARGSIGGASYDISVEKDRGFEVDADVDRVPAGSTWRMVVRHDGARVATRTAHAVRDDGRWEVDFREVRTRDTPGRDRFTVKLERVGGTAVTRTLTFRR